MVSEVGPTILHIPVREEPQSDRRRQRQSSIWNDFTSDVKLTKSEMENFDWPEVKQFSQGIRAASVELENLKLKPCLYTTRRMAMKSLTSRSVNEIDEF